MPLIMNCLDKENRVRVGGNEFTFAPDQIKVFHNTDIAEAINRLKGEHGFVKLPDELEYLAHTRKGETVESIIQPEHKELLEAKRKEGIDKYVTRLRSLVYNAQVLLDRDLKRKGYTHDVRVEYSEGDLRNMEELAKYQKGRLDESKKRVDRAKELEKLLEQSKGA